MIPCRVCAELWDESDHPHRRVCQRCFWTANRRGPGAVGGLPEVAISAELLRRVIPLTHPDRHPGREQEATVVTAQLLALRQVVHQQSRAA